MLAVIGALKRLKKNCELVIHTPSEYVPAGFMQDWIKRWTESDWKNGKGEPVANRAEWEEMAELLNAHEFKFRTGKHAYSIWMEREIRKRKEKEKCMIDLANLAVPAR